MIVYAMLTGIGRDKMREKKPFNRARAFPAFSQVFETSQARIVDNAKRAKGIAR
jgi:hypothetical protein